MRARCGNCRFWVVSDLQFGEVPEGDCRRRSPTDLKGNWPTVKKTMWCGEYEVKRSATLKERKGRR